MASHDPIRIAIVGAGIYARDAHLPAFKSLDPAFTIAAVCSRTEDSARQLAGLIEPGLEWTTDLDGLLARDDIEAVDIVLPIEVMPAVVEKALRAGKHVISEKPIAGDVATGRRLLDAAGDRVWMVAENWRYTAAFLEASNMIQRGEIGKPLMCHWAMQIPMNPQNKYYRAEWRRSGDFPGGLLLDGGVHYAAALRLILGEIARVSAYTAQMRDDLRPVDTLVAALEFDIGALGSLSVTYAAHVDVNFGIHVVGDTGMLRVLRDTIEIARGGITSSGVHRNESVKDELAAFADALRTGNPHRNTGSY
jgi:predicted dehydrogenase